jgi:hypothetical protein
MNNTIVFISLLVDDLITILYLVSLVYEYAAICGGSGSKIIHAVNSKNS